MPRLTSNPFLLIACLAMSIAACDCDSTPPSTSGGGGGGSDTPDPVCANACGSGEQCCVNESEEAVCTDTFALCEIWEACEGDSACNADGSFTCECETVFELSPGQLAVHLDSTLDADGNVIVVGYSPGDPLLGASGAYGDLVLGTWNAAGTPRWGDCADSVSGGMDWQIVDGVPAGSTPVADPEGWRDGIFDVGPDVGGYPSVISLGTGGDIMVSHVNFTSTALRVSTRIDGTWSHHEVDDAGDHIAWTSIERLSDGRPVIAYSVVTAPADTATDSQPSSELRIATALEASPDSSDDWTTTTLGGNNRTYCSAGLCGDGYTCITVGGLGYCVESMDDPSGECADVYGLSNGPDGSGGVESTAFCGQRKGAEAFVDAAGMWAQLEQTSTGLAVAWYDRSIGHLYISRYTEGDGTWSAPFRVDGDRSANNDAGIHVAMFVDSSDVIHLSYVGGRDSALRYARVETDNNVSQRLVVDDGFQKPGLEDIPRNGRVFVGAYSSIAVTASGELRIAYEDQAATALLLARLAPGGGEFTYEILGNIRDDGQYSTQILLRDESGNPTEQSFVIAGNRDNGSEAPDGLFRLQSDVCVHDVAAPAGMTMN